MSVKPLQCWGTKAGISGKFERESWVDIHEYFTSELQRKWENKGFSYKETKKWADVLKEKGIFEPSIDYDFCAWLRDIKGINPKKLSEYWHGSTSKLIYEYNGDWRYIRPSFTPRLRELWEQHNFTAEEVEKWVNIISKTFGELCLLERYDLANYLKKRGYSPEQDLDLVKLISEHKNNLDWEDIHKEFRNQGFRFQWENNWETKKEFIYSSVKDWIDVGLEPAEADFAKHLEERLYYSDNFRYDTKELKRLREEYIDWKRIIATHPSFAPEFAIQWANKGFNAKQVQEWISIGLGIKNVSYIWWLDGIKKVDAEWVLKHGNEKELQIEYKKFLEENSKLDEEAIKQVETLPFGEHGRLESLTPEQELLLDKLVPDPELRKRYEENGKCLECRQPAFTIKLWCSCHFQKNFNKWTSGNSAIDKCIQKCQLKSINAEEVLEWIPYERFFNIEQIAKGGFGTVYKANWIDGPIDYLNAWRSKLCRKESYTKHVILKSLNNSQKITDDFLHEVSCHKLVCDKGWIVSCYGISQDPQTKNYLMVMDYKSNGNLRQYLQGNYRRLKLEDKLFQLATVAGGLKGIHKQGLTHRDLHPGNVLSGNLDSCYITDLGLCKPIDRENQKEEIYGVLPYVAPEILRGKPYTPAADIYSFGIVAHEILSGLPPYREYAHDGVLATLICEGLRPQFQIKIPQLLEDLINKCWDADPSKRPAASELREILWNWREEYIEGVYKKNVPNAKTEFSRQAQSTEEFNQKLSKYSANPEYKIHPSAFYTSRLLDFKNLPEPQNSKEVNEQFYGSIHGSQDINLNINLIENQLDNLETQEIHEETFQEAEPEQQPQILHNPYPQGGNH